MSVSTNGMIWYGVVFEEGYEFPWDEHFDGDIDEWWLEERGFTPSEQLFDREGNYLAGVVPSEEQMEHYFREREDFLASHPLPVEPVNYCSDDYPMWGLAVPDSVLLCHRGYPERFGPWSLQVPDGGSERLLGFCESYGLGFTDVPGWYLTSYWG